MFKNVEEDIKLEGYCFVDEDNLEVRVSFPRRPFMRDDLVVDISSDVCDDDIIIYHKDIPRLIKVLEAAYNHK